MHKAVKAVLQKHGLSNPFTIRQVDFTDLAREPVICVTLHKWKPDSRFDAIKQEIKDKLADQGKKVIVVAIGPGIVA